MKVHHSMDQLPRIAAPVVTVGSFDGVHAGHRTIIGRLNDLARDTGGESVLVTFYPHPRKVLYPETAGKGLKMIYDQEEKVKMLGETGLGHLVIMDFTPGFARTASEAFVEDYLLGRLHARTIVVGFNHYFGHNRTGNFDSLYRMSESRGFRVEEIPAMEIQHEIVSSTRIRKALSVGNIQRANACLEHHFVMQGEVIRAQLVPELPGHLCLELRPLDPDKLVPQAGTYAVSVTGCAAGRKGLPLSLRGDTAENRATTHDDIFERKGLLLIGQEGTLRLYTAQDACRGEAGSLTIRFFRGLNSEVNGPLLEEMEAVNELLY